MQGRTGFCRDWRFVICCIFLSFSIAVTACSSNSEAKNSSSKKSGSTKSTKNAAPRDNTPKVLSPQATGTTVYNGDVVSIDASNSAEGYVMVRYTGSNEKVKFQVKTPDGKDYTYLVTEYDAYEVYPLPGGNGGYTLTLLESASIEDDLYAISFTQDIEVSITDEFTPFLYPNKYINFTADSKTVKKGKSLAKDCYSDLDVVTNIYNYVIKTIAYDTKKAENVAYGYTPDVDKTLSTKKGICFDYAAVMSCMLRSQRIPTKLEVGYVGDIYHAWISCYVDEIGWVDNIIEFDGKNWSLMDPTLAANNKKSDVKKYIGDGSKYVVKYTY